MGIFQKISEQKNKLIEKAKTNYDERKEQKRKEKEAYNTAFNEAKIKVAEQKAQIRADNILKNAQEDAKYMGGRFGRIVATSTKKLYTVAKENKKKNKGGVKPLFTPKKNGGFRL